MSNQFTQFCTQNCEGGECPFGISTADQDNDRWADGNAATYIKSDGTVAPASFWPYEGQGWGWHKHAHACSFWDRLGQPICFTARSDKCWGSGQLCRSDRVELWLTPPSAPPPINPPYPPLPRPWGCRDYFDGGDRVSGVKLVSDSSGVYSVYCDLSGPRQAWTLVMKVAADGTLHYKHTAWSSSVLLNMKKASDGTTYPGDPSDPGDATTIANAKYEAFNRLRVGSLRLDNMNRGTHTVVQPSKPTDRNRYTLLELMQRAGSTALTFSSGESTPFKLVTGGSVTTCGNTWSINGRGGRNFWQRIGGTFSHQWQCNYGTDSNGANTGAESAGFGLLDETWKPWVHAQKGFGTRQAHDYNTVAGGGQVRVKPLS